MGAESPDLDRYIVIENTPGYLPDDDDPPTFSSLRDARAYARELVRTLRDFHAEVGDSCLVRVDSRTAPREWYVVTTREHDLGRVITIEDVIPESSAAPGAGR